MDFHHNRVILNHRVILKNKSRTFNQRNRHSIRPASNIRRNRTSTHTPLTPMELIQTVRNGTLTSSGNNNINNAMATFIDLQNDNDTPTNKSKSIPLIHKNNNGNNNIKLPFHSISQPSPIKDSNDAPSNDPPINDNNNQPNKRQRASSHTYSARKSQTKTVCFYAKPPKITYDNYTNQSQQIRIPPNEKKNDLTFKSIATPRKSAKQQSNPMKHNPFFKQRNCSQSDVDAHHREILYIRDDDHSNGINNRPKSAYFSGSNISNTNK